MDRIGIDLEVRDAPEETQLEFIEPAESPWAVNSLWQRMLTREEALVHPSRELIRRRVEFVVESDARVRVALSQSRR